MINLNKSKIFKERIKWVFEFTKHGMFLPKELLVLSINEIEFSINAFI